MNIELGKTKVHLIPPHGCCGNLLCIDEYTIVSVGKYVSKEGKEIELIQLDNGMFVEPTQIDKYF